MKWVLLLEDRISKGVQIDYKSVKKHKNDIFRLVINILPSSRIEVEDEINEDINRFIVNILDDKPYLKNLGIRGVTIEELLNRIRELYVHLSSEDTQ